jgi:hypothetical protein
VARPEAERESAFPFQNLSSPAPPAPQLEQLSRESDE